MEDTIQIEKQGYLEKRLKQLLCRHHWKWAVKSTVLYRVRRWGWWEHVTSDTDRCVKCGKERVVKRSS